MTPLEATDRFRRSPLVNENSRGSRRAVAADALRLRIQDELGWRVQAPEHGATVAV
jgi:hypothetical protein